MIYYTAACACIHACTYIYMYRFRPCSTSIYNTIHAPGGDVYIGSWFILLYAIIIMFSSILLYIVILSILCVVIFFLIYYYLYLLRNVCVMHNLYNIYIYCIFVNISDERLEEEISSYTSIHPNLR